jgi:hypothetical protein
MLDSDVETEHLNVMIQHLWGSVAGEGQSRSPRTGPRHANVAPETDEWLISPGRDIRMFVEDPRRVSPLGQAATFAGSDPRSGSAAGVALVPMKLLGSDRRITLCHAEATWRGSEPVLYSRP